MKHFTGVILIVTLSFCVYGQDCRLVDSVRGESTGIEIKGGMIFSKDFYTLMIRKHVVSTDSVYYTLLLHAASKAILSDSLLQSTGEFVLFFSNDIVKIPNAGCFNDHLVGIGNIIGFHVETTEAVIRKICEKSIVKVNVFGILETEFSSRKQKQQQKIANCLLNE